MMTWLFGLSRQARFSMALKQFHLKAAKLGLQLSWQDTKVQNLSTKVKEPDITLSGITVDWVECVAKFRYLSLSGRCQEDMHRTMSSETWTLLADDKRLAWYNHLKALRHGSHSF